MGSEHPFNSAEARELALAIVVQIDPDSIEVIEDDWDVLESAGFRPAIADDEHRFVSAGLTALGVAVACIIGKMFAEAATDIVKSEAGALWRRWRQRDLSLTRVQRDKLVSAMTREAEALELPCDLRHEIEQRVERLLEN